MRIALIAFVTCLTVVWAQPVFADKGDVSARKAYRQGKSNFEKGYYEDALASFRLAYALSPRAKLLYNIGVSADRLDRDEDAMEAYEGYLSKLRRPSRAKEVKARVEVLKRTIQKRKQLEAIAAADQQLREAARQRSYRDNKKRKRRAIVGASILGTVGVGALSTLAIGLMKRGDCKTQDTAAPSRCAEPYALNKPMGISMGLVSGISIIGATVWLATGVRKRGVEIAVGPGSLTVRGSF